VAIEFGVERHAWPDSLGNALTVSLTVHGSFS